MFISLTTQLSLHIKIRCKKSYEFVYVKNFFVCQDTSADGVVINNDKKSATYGEQINNNNTVKFTKCRLSIANDENNETLTITNNKHRFIRFDLVQIQNFSRCRGLFTETKIIQVSE